VDRAELEGEQVGLLSSGGLSCTAVAAWLGEAGIAPVCYVADIGQPSPLTAERTARMLAAHGLPVRQVDLRAEMAEAGVSLVRYQASYEGGYWNTTGAAREVLVAGLAPVLEADGCTVLAHGCVGGGNDQLRFARYTAALCPGLKVFAPWTADWMLDRFPDRSSMAGYLAGLGFPAEVTGLAGYSVDASLAGCSHESTELESLGSGVRSFTPLMTAWPQDAPDKPERFEVGFEAGRPTAVDGCTVSALEAVTMANAAAGRNGMPPRSVVENRANGTKCRGVYESPGLDLLGCCVALLYQATLDKPGTQLLAQLSAALGASVYEGRWHDHASAAARAAADVLAVDAAGTVEVELYKGGITVCTLRDLAAGRAAVQTRFTGGGHQWHTTGPALAAG
jgi:argininosuccinate synthase